MNEARLQAYINLIERLLACADDEELNIILQANQELIDPEFLQVMENYAAGLEEQGNNNDAAWLWNMAQQLGQLLSPQAVNRSEYQEFLSEVLQAEYESNDPAVIYPILQRRQHLLDDTFAQLLQQEARNVFSEGNTEEVARIAGVIGNLCLDISDFPLGSRANNLEIAITGYQALLEVYTREAFPEDWATSQNNLGNAYSDRIRGERADNLELAIAALNLSLGVYTRDAFPYEWARSQNNLGAAYRNRIRGERADNLELAIGALNLSLEVYTREAFPYEWATTQTNLGIAYGNHIREERADNLELAIVAFNLSLEVYTREAFPYEWATTQTNLGNAYIVSIRGERADNLELAIVACNQSLEVYTREAFPEDWAGLQNNLGIAYRNRIRGERADNLELAIVACNQSLEVYTREAFPEYWAGTQTNLGNAYQTRIRGERADNLELAIVAYNLSLEVLTRDAFPEDWAGTQNNLGNAYLDRIIRERADNLELAIEAYNLSLEVYTREAFPEYWARSQNNLGEAYRNRIRRERADNLELAIEAYNLSLEVYTREAFPYEWSRSQHNLGVAYSSRIRGERADNLKLAIAAYNLSLEVYTATTFPIECLKTGRNLGNTANLIEDWETAIKGYNLAIEAVENTRLEALNPQSRQEVLSDAIDVFHRIIQVHLNLNQPEKALEYIERSKTRNLVELMTQKNLKPRGVSQTIIEEYEHLYQQVVNEQIRLQHQSINQNLIPNDNLTSYITDYSHLQEYKQALDTFIEQQITPIDPIFKLTQKIEPISFKAIQSLTDAETCLLQWYITNEKIIAFIVPSDGEIKVWQSSGSELGSLIDATNNYLQLYYSENGKQEWINQLPNLLQTFAQTLHLNHILSLIPHTCKRLIIIPHLYLHILPLHALPINENQILQDKYDIQYAPSCQLLQITQQHQSNELTHLFAIQNPTQDLIYTDLEVNIISTLFNQSQIIAKDKATKDTITTHLTDSDNHCHHFSCHGGFNPTNPLESALFLANQEPLTLGEIFELNLKKSRLVVLSACETGLIDLNSISDEYIGLPSGFLFAGSPSVVSSLWTVSDLSTAFLMMKFYEILLDKTQQISVPVALKTVQNWLKNLTNQQALQYLETRIKPHINKLYLNKPIAAQKFYNGLLNRLNSTEYPFAHPFYWAAFIASGQ